MSAGDGIVFTPWPHEALPGWSLPALEAGKCVALQSGPAFERVHLRLYRALFTEGRNIADRGEVERIVAEAEHGVQSIPTVVIPETGRCLVGLAELSQYRAAVDEAARAAS